MVGFTKLHQAILDSSIWSESHARRICWITMLAMADGDGVVLASVSGLAARARITREECEDALACFLGPDPDSRDGTTGERIEKVPGGWLILNHANYREKQTREQRLTAERVARHREKGKATALRNVTAGEVTGGNAPSASASASASASVQKPEDVSEQTWNDWLAHRKSKRASVTERVIETTRARAKDAGQSLEAALAYWVAQGTQGYYPPDARKGALGGKPQPLATRIGTDFSGDTVSRFTP